MTEEFTVEKFNLLKNWKNTILVILSDVELIFLREKYFLQKMEFITVRYIIYLQGPAFVKVDLNELYPTLGLGSPHECVTFNFGKRKYKFDLDSHIKLEMKDGI